MARNTHKGKTKIRFESIKDRDLHLRKWTPGSYTIDSKDPLIVWLTV